MPVSYDPHTSTEAAAQRAVKARPIQKPLQRKPLPMAEEGYPGILYRLRRSDACSLTRGQNFQPPEALPWDWFSASQPINHSIK